MVVLFNGRHGEWLARIAYEGKSRCIMIVEQRLRSQRVPPDVWLLFAPVKATPMNNIARMSTELGVGRICPVLTEHTDVTRTNTARLRSNAVEAAEQSTRLNVPIVNEPVPLAELLEDWETLGPDGAVALVRQRWEGLKLLRGTGGDEASIFAGDLYRMYTKYCESKGWKVSVVDMSEGTSGGFKEVIIFRQALYYFTIS